MDDGLLVPVPLVKVTLNILTPADGKGERARGQGVSVQPPTLGLALAGRGETCSWYAMLF